MPKGFAPTAFVSSTCYDLGQIRDNLKNFLAGIGFEPLLSEVASFPVNPQASAIENCVNAVKERADIFVLVVGSRYGTLDSSGKSITNLEYLAAKAKGIPIFVFVAKQIIHNLPFWKANPTADCSSFVDTPKLFDFVDQLYGGKQHWVYPFELANDIIAILREQLAYLFMDALMCREQLIRARLPEYVTGLSGVCLKFVLEKPIGWEFYLCAQVLTEEIEGLRSLKRDLEYGLKIGPIDQINEPQEAFSLICSKFSEIRHLSDSATKLLNVVAQNALGASGVAGDPEHIVYFSRRMAKLYRSALEWSIDFNNTDADPEFENVFRSCSVFSNVILKVIEGMPHRIVSEIDKAVAAEKIGTVYVANMQFTFEPPDTAEFSAEMERLRTLFGIA